MLETKFGGDPLIVFLQDMKVFFDFLKSSGMLFWLYCNVFQTNNFAF